MVDLMEFNGQDALRADLIKKRHKAQVRSDELIEKANAKIAPVLAEIALYDELIAVMDKRTHTAATAAESADTGEDVSAADTIAETQSVPAVDSSISAEPPAPSIPRIVPETASDPIPTFSERPSYEAMKNEDATPAFLRGKKKK
jgi:hypothetical protein